jgi:serine/threonine-protein kinase
MESTLGHYHIIKLLGAGGMGEVYLAEDSRLERRVALKLLPPRLAADTEHLLRFEREARALAALSHPNIVTIHTVEHVGDYHFLTMEFVEGKTLAQLIPSAGMAPASLLAVAIPLADALATAHRHGVTHRDLKPANVMVSDEGRVKVLDFGLARLGRPAGEPSASPTTDALTRAGQIVGTCAYMSPEQVEGRTLDHRTDIFSLGTILFEMATGRRPFQRAIQIDVLVAIRKEQPPAVSTLSPVMPGEFDRLVARCLEKDPDRRVQTAHEVCNELQAVKEVIDTGARPSGARDGMPASRHERRVAVLPFANMSADQEQEYFCDGMAEDLINALAHVEDLQVAARTSAFAFKGQNRDVREIGRLLDVGSVLEGSVRRSGNRLRITAQLIRVADGMHLWSERFDRQLDDVFAVQDEISLAIVDRLKVQLLAGEEAQVIKRHTVDPEAHNLYLKGRYLWNRRTEGDITRAMACYEQAAARDPEFGLPHVGLADALSVMGQWGMRRACEVFPKAKAEAQRALAIDAGLAEAHTSSGLLAAFYDWDWPAAERHFTRALSLNPRYSQARRWYALYLCVRERFAEAIRESQLGLELEPLSPVANFQTGQVLYHVGRMTEAIEQLTKAVELDPHMPLSYAFLAPAYLMAGRLQDAADAAERSNLAGLVPFWKTVVLVREGRLEEARRAFAELEKLEQSQYVGQAGLAIAAAALGDMDGAVARLERAFNERDPQLPFIKILPGLGDMHSVLAHPGFQAVIRKLGLPP